jgi:hypothetical protein
MLLGGIIAWVIAPVWLADRGYLVEHAHKVDILLLVMWPAVGMLVAGGISALALRWRVLLKTFKGLTGDAVSGDLPPDRRHRQRGVCASSSPCSRSSSARPCGTRSSRCALGAARLVALRVLGETNWGPISTMTNLMQALFGGIAPGICARAWCRADHRRRGG